MKFYCFQRVKLTMLLKLVSIEFCIFQLVGVAAVVILLGISLSCFAADEYSWSYPGSGLEASTPLAACNVFNKDKDVLVLGVLPVLPFRAPLGTYSCVLKYCASGGPLDQCSSYVTVGTPWYVQRRGNNCAQNKIFNPLDGFCEEVGVTSSRVYSGISSASNSCIAPSDFVGNPVSVTSGKKSQVDFVYRAGDKTLMAIYYDSLNGYWRHSYSERLVLGDDTVLLLDYDGRQILFRVGDEVSSESPYFGMLKKNTDGWMFRRSNGDVSRFNVYGLLSSKQYANGELVSLKRNDDGVVEVQGSDFRFSYAEDLFDQVLFISGAGKDVNFSYDQTKRLISYSSVFQEQKTTRNFLYENARVPELLTGITDERGIRYATWSYDDQGRAISSEHAGGAEKVTLAYNDDGSTTVTNALGKQTTYRFQVIQGVKRITAIEGEPSADCPAANSTYTYNDRGQVLTATDAEGRVTRYAYNDRGLEISRIEGEGTAEARTVTTEWDPERYRRTQVTADGRRTLYSYDDQGRLLSERTEAVSAN